MTDERLFDRLAAHAGPADIDPGFEDRLYALLQQEMGRSRRSSRPILLLVAALLLALAVGSAALILSGGVEPPLPPDSSLTWVGVAIDERSLAIPDPGSLDVRNTRLAWLGDRFVLVDGGVVSTSTDGRQWTLLDDGDPSGDSYRLLSGSSATATWEDTTAVWVPDGGLWGLQILRPPSQPVAKDFDGSVATVGIGPAGIVARVHSAVDFDGYITSLLGPAWAEQMTTFSFEDGILRIATDDDRSLEIVWADHGFEPGDVADRGFGWYSPDGDQWTPIPEFPANVFEIVGVSDGFIARGHEGRCDGCADSTAPYGMWHSVDGLIWRRVGTATEGSVLPWGQDALVTDGIGRFDVWTTEGSSALPMAAELPTEWTAASQGLDSGRLAAGSGSLGLALVNTENHEILFTPNGVDWRIYPMSTEMAAATGGPGAIRSSVAVGTDSVVVLLWTGEFESAVPSLWVGTAGP